MGVWRAGDLYLPVGLYQEKSCTTQGTENNNVVRLPTRGVLTGNTVNNASTRVDRLDAIKPVHAWKARRLKCCTNYDGYAIHQRIFRDDSTNRKAQGLIVAYVTTFVAAATLGTPPRHGGRPIPGPGASRHDKHFRSYFV